MYDTKHINLKVLKVDRNMFDLKSESNVVCKHTYDVMIYE